LSDKTNALGLELSALVGEYNGEAIPLAFIFIGSTDGSSTTGAKERILDSFLSRLAKFFRALGFTLTDKELCEISVFRKRFPLTKHQLCWWHAIRYIEIRLSENRPPALYNAALAHARFSFIDALWYPSKACAAEVGDLDANSGSACPDKTTMLHDEAVETEKVSHMRIR
jgi:hypothetical protein